MDVQREVEVKLAVPDAFVQPDLLDVEGVASVQVRTLSLRATYWDTADLRLARAGITLRHRLGEGRPRWTLKVATDDGVGRWELSVAGAGAKVPAQLHGQVRARLRGTELAPVARLSTKRVSTLLLGPDGQQVAEVVDDTVTVPDGPVWRELEVEERADRALAGRVVRRLEEAGAQVGSQVGKAYRAMGPGSLLPPDVPAVQAIRRRDPVGLLVQRCLLQAEHRVLQHDPGVRTDRDDAVHQLRVACRTLRSDLRTFAAFLDDDRVGPLREELRWLGQALGETRDLEVLRRRLAVTARSRSRPLDLTGVDAALEEQQVLALAKARTALDSDRYVALLQLLHEVGAAPSLSKAAAVSCRDGLEGLVAREWKRLRRQTRRLGTTQPPVTWHEARIRAKRTRYAAEAVAVALGTSPQGKRARVVQELLGEHQDAEVAVDRLRALADARPDLAFVCGALSEREAENARAARKEFLARRTKLRLG